MRKLLINDRVRLVKELPGLPVHTGDVGVVRSVWFSPDDVLEVEFPGHESEPPDRCLVPTQCVELEDLPEQEANGLCEE